MPIWVSSRKSWQKCVKRAFRRGIQRACGTEKLELQKLFATYARADTDILISQRIRSLQNQVVDIAPEQYQKLRQDFLNGLTVEMLNRDLRQQLSQEMALILLQPKGEPEYDMKELQKTGFHHGDRAAADAGRDG